MLITYRKNSGFEGQIIALDTRRDEAEAIAETEAWLAADPSRASDTGYIVVDTANVASEHLVDLFARQSAYSVRDGRLCKDGAVMEWAAS